MARPQKYNVDYFPYICNEGPTMEYILTKYQQDGYIVWMRTLRQLAITDYHFLDFTNELTLPHIAAKCFVTEERYMEIITELVRFKEFDLELWSFRVLYSEQFVETIKLAYKKRNFSPLTKNDLFPLLQDKGILKPSKSSPKPSKSIQSTPGSTQSKVKNSKVKNSKVSVDTSTTKTPMKKLVEIYHKVLPELPKVQTLTDTRKIYLRTRYKEHPELAWWENTYFPMVKQSQFLMGKKNGFKANFDFLIDPNKMTKILEGQYADYEHKTTNNSRKNRSVGQTFRESSGKLEHPAEVI